VPPPQVLPRFEAATLPNAGQRRFRWPRLMSGYTMALIALREVRARREGINIMAGRSTLSRVLGIVLIGSLCAIAGPDGAAKAQAPAPAAPTPVPAPVQPWGLPPLPAGVGPVEKFADVNGTSQGKFLEGGAIPKAICGSWRSARGGFRT
jgi:hypothetical protein